MIKPRTRHAVLVVEAAIAIGVVVGLWYGWQMLRQVRSEVIAAQQKIENIPQQQLQQEEVASELKRQDARLRQLGNYLPRREAIGDVVAAIEGVAQKNGIAVIVPEVTDDVRIGADRKPITQTGRYRDVRLTVQGYGDPIKLIAFLHGVEHLPYIIKVPDFEVTTDYAALPTALSVSPPTETSPPQVPAALLNAGVILTITLD